MNEEEIEQLNILIDKYIQKRYKNLIHEYQQTIDKQQKKIDDLKERLNSAERANIYRNKIIGDLNKELKEIKDQFYANELTPEDFADIIKMDYEDC